MPDGKENEFLSVRENLLAMDRDFRVDILKARKSSLVNDQPVKKIIVGVAGGSAAGKTTLCENIYRQMAFDRNFKVEIVSLDSFYKDVDKNNIKISDYNFDHPNALDFDLAYHTLRSLIDSSGESVAIPQYSFIQHARLKEPAFIGPANVIFFQGLMAFYDKRIRDLLTYKIFINCDDDIRLCRRLLRDTSERGRTVENILDQYNRFVKNAFRDFIQPSMVYADIIIPGFRNNRISVDFIVQHIKNVARRINFQEKVAKTKIYFFGESEIYDLDYSPEEGKKAIHGCESFLVFPTSDQHKRELDFFIATLLSQIFSMEYFIEIYTQQFLKILKSLLSQLTQLQSFDFKKMEVVSVYNLQQFLDLQPNQFTIKVVLFPAADKESAGWVLQKIKKYIQRYPHMRFVILNAFCDIKVPRELYQAKANNIIMINLFIIANDKRFREIMSNNNTQANIDSFDWFINNPDIANQCVDIISKHFNINRASDHQIYIRHYNQAISQMKQKKQSRVIDEKVEKWGLFQQWNVYSQEHDNLCGFHMLSTACCLDAKEDITSRDIFIRNYYTMRKELGRNNFEPLERGDLQELQMKCNLLEKDSISQLIYSFKYIQSSEEDLSELSNMFENLHAKQIENFYILLGVVDHFYLLRVNQSSIDFYDSANASLTDAVNGTNHQPSISDDPKTEQLRKANLKELLQIILDVYHHRRLFKDILVEKRIEDVVGSYNALNTPEEIEKWIKDDYPKPVIISELFNFMKPRQQVKISEQHSTMLKKWLMCPRIEALFTKEELDIAF